MISTAKSKRIPANVTEPKTTLEAANGFFAVGAFLRLRGLLLPGATNTDVIKEVRRLTDFREAVFIALEEESTGRSLRALFSKTV